MTNLRGFRLLACAAALASAGCASLPDVTLQYRLATWNAGVKAVLTLGCLPSGGEAPPTLLVAHSVTASVGYAADPDPKAAVAIRLADLDAWTSDTDLKITFTDDGRLKTINSTSTGQGEAVVKAFVAAAASFSAFKTKPSPPQPQGMTDGPPRQTPCEVLARRGLIKDPVTLSYRITNLRDHLGRQGLAYEPASDSQVLHDALKDSIGFPTLSLDVGTVVPEDLRVAASAAALEQATVHLPLQRTGRLSLTTRIRDDAAGKPIDTRIVVVPMAERYSLPVPKPALFGKVSFSLTLSEAGRILEAGYGKSAGAAAAAGALGSLAAADTQATNAETAALKAEADLMAQQQRLVNCRLKPAECK